MEYLYIDFDGVIADTIKPTYEMMKCMGINLDDRDKVIEFYKQLNWYKLLETTEEINCAFKNIQKIRESKIYKNIFILTTVNSIEEMIAKSIFVRKRDRYISLISVPRGVDKNVIVNAENSVLIDDYSKNLILWQQSNGISIKFSDSEDKRFLTIYNLSDVVDNCKFLELKRNI